MSTETSPAYTSESENYKSEPPITTGQLEAMLADTKPIENGDEPYEAQVPDSRSFSEKAKRRVADFLYDMSEKLIVSAEVQERKTNQNAAYDSYAENIATTQSRELDEAKADRAEARAEKIEQAREVFRGFGRSANRLLVRANVELGYAKTVASEKVDDAKAAYANVKETVTDSLLAAKETIVDKTTEVKEAVSDKTAEIKTVVAEKAESTRVSSETAKLKAELEMAVFMHDVRERVESGKEKLNSGVNYLKDQKNTLVMEYQQAREAVTSRVSEKVSQIKGHFAERKAAAEARKAERQAAAESKRAEREKNRDVIKRTAAVELQNRLEQREANKTERAEKIESRRRNRSIGHSALKTAVKVGFKTGKETYDAIKRN